MSCFSARAFHLAALLFMGACTVDTAVTDATLPGAGGELDAAPARSCGCPPGAVSCVSLEVFEWAERRVVVDGEGLTVYLVDSADYETHAAPLATAVPDASGRVVFTNFANPAGGQVYVVLDDEPGAASDNWTHTGVGPIDPTGVTECVAAPAVERARGNTYLMDYGVTPDVILVGAVILELVDPEGAPVSGIGIETAPIAATLYFTEDREHVDPYANGTTAAGAALTADSAYCSPLCRNLTCACGDPTCGPNSPYGGAGNGFFFFSMLCDAPE